MLWSNAKRGGQGMIGGFRQIIAKEGAGALATGLGPTVVGYAIQGAFKFGGYVKMLFLPELDTNSYIDTSSGRSKLSTTSVSTLLESTDKPFTLELQPSPSSSPISLFAHLRLLESVSFPSLLSPTDWPVVSPGS